MEKNDIKEVINFIDTNYDLNSVRSEVDEAFYELFKDTGSNECASFIIKILALKQLTIDQRQLAHKLYEFFHMFENMRSDFDSFIDRLKLKYCGSMTEEEFMFLRGKYMDINNKAA